MSKTKLELNWIGKEHRPRLEPRILVEHAELSYHAKTRRADDLFDNILMHGDNLLALRALESSHTGLIKCIYIDPPYNISVASDLYDDGLEHSTWLSLMRDRLEILFRLLSDDGLIFIQIDDEEVAYLTVLMDEVFGRHNRVNIISVKMSEATGVKMSHARKRMPKTKEFILMYKKDVAEITPIKVPLEKWNDEYKEILIGINEQSLDELKELIDSDNHDETSIETANAILEGVEIKSLSKYFKDEGVQADNQDQFKWDNAWRIVQAVGAGSIKERAISARVPGQAVSSVLSSQKKLYLFKSEFDQTSRDPRIRIIFADKYLQYNPGDFWTDIKTTGGVGQEGGVMFPKGKKPEALIHRILLTATKPGDWVLDSFAGSGTTGAVAHKMGRKWIMVELGDHCESHILPRLKRVIDGEDSGGITKTVSWRGGGGFRYFRMAPSLLEKDQFDQWVISKAYNPAMLAEAMCKHFSFTYSPSAEHYWLHGHSTETDFIYVTTNSLTHDQLRAISDEVGPERSLLICCKAFQGTNVDSFDNLTIRKIPGAILDKCEWGKDDYSLKIEALPLIEDEAETEDELEVAAKPRGRPPKGNDEPSLFDAENDA
jgi:adenine-specific DNA-methyltransferase